MPATTMALINATPRDYPSVALAGGKVRSFIERFTLASDAVGPYEIGILPAGARFLYGVLTSSVSLGTSTVAIGVTGTTGKYRAAATFTAVDTPTPFGNAAAVGAEGSAEERVLLSVATAALPASGTLVIELFYSQAN